MRHSRLLVFALALSLVGGGAQAQNFFERLFGITPSRPQPPATVIPAPSLPSGGGGASVDEPRRTAPPPVTAKPTALRAPSEDAIVGRELKQNGANGGLRFERTARADYRLKLNLIGRRAAQSTETCAIALGGEEGAALVSLGRPEGVPRYQLQDTTCPLQIDVLDEAVLVKGPTDACVFTTANCQADPSGLWGPDPGQLVGRARDYEQSRGTADKAVRDNYKVMVQRARPEGVRPVVAEQAAFSSDREMLCRGYAREGSHSFCNSRVTEARAISLATRLGVTVTASTQPAEPRSRRRPEPYGIPPTDELMRGSVIEAPSE